MPKLGLNFSGVADIMNSLYVAKVTIVIDWLI